MRVHHCDSRGDCERDRGTKPGDARCVGGADRRVLEVRLKVLATRLLIVGSLTRRLALEPSWVFGGLLEKASPSESMRRIGSGPCAAYAARIARFRATVSLAIATGVAMTLKHGVDHLSI